MQHKHKLALEQITRTFKPVLIKSWTAAVEKWDEDHTQPNPYKEPDNSLLYLEFFQV